MFVHVFGGQSLLSDVFLDLFPPYLYVEERSHLNSELEDLVNQAGELVVGIYVYFPTCWEYREIFMPATCT